jgi:anti-sigma factor RsiW
MNCRKVREWLADAVDGSLETHLRDAVASHLAACADCREEHRLLATTRHLLSTYGATRAPADFTHLATRVAVRSRRPAFLLGLGRGLAMTTAAVAVGLVAWQWQRPQPPPTELTPPQVMVREVPEVEELHEAFVVQQSLDARDGLVLFAPRWEDRRR